MPHGIGKHPFNVVGIGIYDFSFFFLFYPIYNDFQRNPTANMPEDLKNKSFRVVWGQKSQSAARLFFKFQIAHMCNMIFILHSNSKTIQR